MERQKGASMAILLSMSNSVVEGDLSKLPVVAVAAGSSCGARLILTILKMASLEVFEKLLLRWQRRA